MLSAAKEKNLRSETADDVDEADIVERIFEAVMERRLPPGTKLSESALCQAFGVGRMRIRRCLLLLASRDVVELQSNRGAFVARPSAEQAREVFEARLTIEPTIARLVAARATDADIAALKAHTDEEATAHEQGNRREAIRLSGQFHVRLAEVAGNTILERMMKDLVTRTSLILGIYGSPGVATCRDHDHCNLIAALQARDPQQAAALMTEHLRQIEGTMDLTQASVPSVDIVQVFSEPPRKRVPPLCG